MKFFIKWNQAEKMDTSEGRNSSFTIFMDRVQRQWAGWMERKTAGLSRSNWIWLLVIFLLLGIGSSFYVIVRSLKEHTVYSFEVQDFKKYDRLFQHGDSWGKQSVSGRNDLRKLEQHRDYMDSLGRSPTGRSLYDSIIRGDPDLMEDLKKTINYYKNKLNQ